MNLDLGETVSGESTSFKEVRRPGITIPTSVSDWINLSMYPYAKIARQIHSHQNPTLKLKLFLRWVLSKTVINPFHSFLVLVCFYSLRVQCYKPKSHMSLQLPVTCVHLIVPG